MSMTKNDLTDVRVFAPRRARSDSIKVTGVRTHQAEITDIHIPFLSIVALMIKATFAFLLVWVLLFILGWMFALMIGFPAIGILGGVMGL